MMRFFGFFVLAFLFLFPVTIFSQSFKDFKNTKEGKVVYFKLQGIRDQEHAGEVQIALTKDQNVLECAIYKSKEDFVGKIFLKNDVDAAYFQKILFVFQVDFDKSSLIDYLTAFDSSISAHYPLFVNSGNPEKDKKIFDDAKKAWMKNYPKEVAQVTGKNYYEVVKSEPFYLNEQPLFIDTGDRELDSKIFETRKKDWEKKKLQGSRK